MNDVYSLKGKRGLVVGIANDQSIAYGCAKQFRVHALSPGPLRTRAASGINRFDETLEQAAARAPQHQLVSIEDCGAVAGFLVSDAARAMTGSTFFVDGGYHIVA